MTQLTCYMLMMITLVVTTTQDDTNPPDVPELPKFFQADIVITSPQLQSTFFGQVHVDTTAKQGMLMVENEDWKLQVIHTESDANPQTLLIQELRTEGGLNEVPISCSSSFDRRLNQCTEQLLLLPFDQKDKFFPEYLLGLVPGVNFINNEFEVLGIKSSLFEGLNLTLATLTEPVDVETYWYLGDSDWNIPRCNSVSCTTYRVPLKTRISTIMSCSEDEHPKPIDIEYLYYNYDVQKPDPTVFQVPQGVYCPNLTATITLPLLKDGFITGKEESTPEIKYPLSSTLYYDGHEKLLREDGSYLGNDFKGDGGRAIAYIAEIKDYNTGVIYSIDRQRDTCEVSNMTAADARRNLRDVYTVLLDDESFNREDALYVGKRNVRGIECEVWNVLLEHGSLLEIYLNKIEVKGEGGGSSGYLYEPVFFNETNVVLDEEIIPIKRVWYNYDDDIPKRSAFDYMGLCIPEEYKKRFQIEIQGNQTLVKSNPDAFIKAVIDEIADETKISVFRIENAMLDYVTLPHEEFILFTATMLEHIYIAGGVGSNVANPSEIILNDFAYDTLASNVYNKKFTVNLQIGQSGFFYDGTSIRDDIITPSISGDSELFKEMYELKGSLDLQNSAFDYQLSGESTSSCAMACIESDAMLCESFAYCVDKASCKLSHLHFENMTKDQTTPKGRCQLFSRNYLQDYKVSRYMKVKPTDDESKVPSNTFDADQCARQCSRDPDKQIPFFCEGFDVCLNGDAKTCEFRSRHVLEIPLEDVIPDKNCWHYSRDYIQDFVDHVGYKAEGAKEILYAHMSADECARRCVLQADTTACKAFEMCRTTAIGQKTACRLLETGKDDPNVIVKPDSNCDHYSRERIGSPRHVRPDIPKPTSKSHKPYSSGAMAGLGVSMVVVGFILGAGIMLLLLRFRPCCFAERTHDNF